LIVHLPTEWLQGAKVIEINGGVEGSVELLQAEAALHRIVARYAGRPDHYAVKVKLPTNRGLPGPYNGRSYDGLYLIKERVEAQRSGNCFRASEKSGASRKVSSSANDAGAHRTSARARHQHLAADEYEQSLVERARRLRRAS
jgi:hypothetical protein